jgi:hypothetical protein
MPPPRGETLTRATLFPSTRWTIVLEAGDDEASSRQSLSALSELRTEITERLRSGAPPFGKCARRVNMRATATAAAAEQTFRRFRAARFALARRATRQ